MASLCDPNSPKSLDTWAFKDDLEGVTKGEDLSTLPEGETETKKAQKKTDSRIKTDKPKRATSKNASAGIGKGGDAPDMNHLGMPTRKKRSVSDDDECPHGSKKIMLKSCRGNNTPMAITPEDCMNIIEDAFRDGSIDENKYARLHECIQAGDWSEVAFSLLCENIPLKRRGKGYSCRVCQVPKKGHTCPYCPICSTPENKIKKNDEHVCINCPMCYEIGKKKKKMIQVKCEGHVCPHGPPTAKLPKKVPV
eukprot:CAMPEP_0172329804 /NCGR_PEP_ID=MMETSP1058-20130122/61074_1 /TAXON_ID=83371 /ORGANISM="Detonula confervacea, Strain CCMP 353" /LENGTH=250 /DNA_ID=CAMNT_0013046995 /DNA_START=1608 /DNA_END=2360 /DNA_ORIENTATION=-